MLHVKNVWRVHIRELGRLNAKNALPVNGPGAFRIHVMIALLANILLKEQVPVRIVLRELTNRMQENPAVFLVVRANFKDTLHIAFVMTVQLENFKKIPRCQSVQRVALEHFLIRWLPLLVNCVQPANTDLNIQYQQPFKQAAMGA